jgi:dTDP-4-dehydrorhamnose 3,5-epimerase-like enzyme
MKIKNIWRDVQEPLELHIDSRGAIVDIFYKSNIEHVAVVSSEPNTLRGNHYHKQSTQHMLMTKGSLEYWFKPVDSTEPAKMILAKVGDIVSTLPNEIHTLVIREDGNQFVVFSEGVRGGADYESDTFRVKNIVPDDKLPI